MGNHRCKDDELDITDKLPNKEYLPFRGGKLDITVNEKVKLGYLSV